jgi:hypothetical protein
MSVYPIKNMPEIPATLVSSNLPMLREQPEQDDNPINNLETRPTGIVLDEAHSISPQTWHPTSPLYY